MTIVTALILLNYVIIATAALGLWSRIVRIERAVSNEARLTRAEFEPLPARLRAVP